MTPQSILQILQSEIHSVVFATLDEQGLPQTCVIDLMLRRRTAFIFSPPGESPFTAG